jgi:nucleoside-diphosphate-sugar epimerase
MSEKLHGPVLVTGASGFVGRGVVPYLIERGWMVRPAYRRDAPPGSVAVGDISGDTDWREALTGCDSVVHLAGLAHLPDALAGAAAARFEMVNVLGTAALARQAAAAGIRRMVLVSSAKVMGEGQDRPYSETDAPQPSDGYAWSKLAGEKALERVGAETGMQWVILRPPLVYGPTVGANFARLIAWADRGVPLPLGAIDNRRSMIARGNLASVVELALRNHAAANRRYLVADGADMSTPDLLRALAKALGRPSRLLPVPPALLKLAGRLAGRGSDVERLTGSLALDISRVRDELGWVPPLTPAHALAETAAWYRLSGPGTAQSA